MGEESKAKPEKIKQDLVIQQKVYDMIMYAYPAIEQFPKSQKFSLAQDMKKCLDSIMRLVIMANKKYTKKTTLQELDVENEALKIYIRMAFELGYLPPKKYEIWSQQAVEVGRMIGGWIKSARETPPPDPKKQAGAEEEEQPLPGQITFEPEEEFFCSECNAPITKKIKEYSEQHFSAAFCYKCQRKHKADFR